MTPIETKVVFVGIPVPLTIMPGTRSYAPRLRLPVVKLFKVILAVAVGGVGAMTVVFENTSGPLPEASIALLAAMWKS